MVIVLVSIVNSLQLNVDIFASHSSSMKYIASLIIFLYKSELEHFTPHLRFNKFSKVKQSLLVENELRVSGRQ